MTYYIAHNGESVFHYGSITEQQVVSTGQPHLEKFDNEQEWLDRLKDFGITPETKTE